MGMCNGLEVCELHGVCVAMKGRLYSIAELEKAWAWYLGMVKEDRSPRRRRTR